MTFVKSLMGGRYGLLAAVLVAGVVTASAEVKLGPDRLMIFNTWTDGQDYGQPQLGQWEHEGTVNKGALKDLAVRRHLLTGTNHWHEAGWSATNVVLGSSAFLDATKSQYLAPTLYNHSVVIGDKTAFATNYAANFFNDTSATLVSPLYPEGIGTLRFDAISSLSGMTGNLQLQVATNMWFLESQISTIENLTNVVLEAEGKGYRYNWMDDSTIACGATRTAFQRNFNYFGAMRFRLVRKDTASSTAKYKDEKFLVADNFQVSYPHLGVKIESVSVSQTRGKSQSATVTCVVSNTGDPMGLSDKVYSDYKSRTVEVSYRIDDGEAKTVVATFNSSAGVLGQGECYVADIFLPENANNLTYECAVSVPGFAFTPYDYVELKAMPTEPVPTAQTAAATVDVSRWTHSAVAKTLGVDRMLLFNAWTNGVDYGDYYGAVQHEGGIPSGTSGLGNTARARKMLLNGSNHVYRSGWVVLDAAVGTSALMIDAYGATEEQFANYIAPSNYVQAGVIEGNIRTNWQANLYNTLGAQIVSPAYSNGIGTIYFDAVNVNTDVYFKVQIATNLCEFLPDGSSCEPYFTNEFSVVDGAGDLHEYSYDWQTLEEIHLDYGYATVRDTDGFYRGQIQVDWHGAGRVRFIRSRMSETIERIYSNVNHWRDDALIAIDNIRISEPPAECVIEVDEMSCDPAYPSVNQPFRLQCRVSNKPGLPTNLWSKADARLASVVWRWRYVDQIVNPWTTNSAVYVSGTEGDDGRGNNELWETALPGQANVGDIEYFFIAEFDGLRYKPFDYTLFNHVYHGTADGSDNRSPSMNGDAENPYMKRLRAYKSDIGQMFFECPAYGDVEMMLIGDDVWRGMVPSRGQPYPDNRIVGRFRGTNTYYAATGSEPARVEAKARYWAEPGVEYPAEIPMGGILEEVPDNEEKVAFVQVDSEYLGVEIDFNKMGYNARRAEFQDFNEWQSYTSYFASTYKTPDAVQTPEEKGFEQWILTEEGRSPCNDYFKITTNALGNACERYHANLNKVGAVAGAINTEVRNARIDEELLRSDLENCPYSDLSQVPRYGNLAVRLIGGDALSYEGRAAGVTAPGTLRPEAFKISDGLGDLSFRAHVAAPWNPNQIVQYTGDDLLEWGETNYCVTATFNVTEASPAQHSYSLFGYANFSDTSTKPQHTYYELRLSQVHTPGNGAYDVDVPKHAALQLFRCCSGVKDELKNFAVNNISSLSLKGNKVTLKLLLYSEIGSTHIKAIVSSGGKDIATKEDNDAASIRPQLGTFGFMATDCQVEFSEVKIAPVNKEPTIQAGQYTYTVDTLREKKPRMSGSSVDVDNYNWRYNRDYYRVMSGTIRSLAPSAELAVYWQPLAKGANPDEEEWGDPVTNFVVTSYSYQKFVWSAHLWKSGTFRLSNDALRDIVVDSVAWDHWKGCSDTDGSWTMEDARIINVGTLAVTNKAVEFDASRADLSVDGGLGQRLESPGFSPADQVRDDGGLYGISSIGFKYRVDRAPAVVSILLDRDDGQGFVPFWSATNTAPTPGWIPVREFIGCTNGGTIQVVNDCRGQYTNSLVVLDDLYVWSYPMATNTAWKTYNGRVTDADVAHLPLDGSSFITLNDSRTADVHKDFAPMDLAQPYLKTPVIANGIGELRFEARLYNADDPPARIDVYGLISPNGWNDEDKPGQAIVWEHLDELTINSMDAKSYTVYAKNSNQLKNYDPKKYFAMRIQTRNDGTQPRVCLENVSIAEPIVPGFEIKDVKLLRHIEDEKYEEPPTDGVQPVCSDAIGVRARVTNLRLGPKEIKLYVSYHIGRDKWGVENIWGPRTSWWTHQSTTLPMINPNPDDPYLFETAPLNDIPEQEENEVVQYVVWATFKGEGDASYVQVQNLDNFESPRWYYPTDLNEGKVGGNRSPYYIVYLIPRGAVFVNELNLFESDAEEDMKRTTNFFNPFIEFAIPAKTDMNEWGFDLVGYDGEITTVLSKNFEMPEVGKNEVTNRYAFYVVSEHPDNIGWWGALPNVDLRVRDFFGRYGEGKITEARNPGGIRVRRPLGSYDQMISFDLYGDEENKITQNDDHYIYVGSDFYDETLAVTNGTGESYGDWATLAWDDVEKEPDPHYAYFREEDGPVWTPGAPNLLQVMPTMPDVYAGLSNVLVTAEFAPLTGADYQRIGAAGVPKAEKITFKMKKGTSTNIYYDVRNWYRVRSATATGETTGKRVDLTASLSPDHDSSTNCFLTVANLTERTTITAKIGRDPTFEEQNVPPNVIEWLEDYNDAKVHEAHSQVQIENDKYRPMSWLEMFWFNVNPELNNTLRGSIGLQWPKSSYLTKEEMQEHHTSFRKWIPVTVTLDEEQEDGSIVTKKIDGLQGSTSADRPTFKVKIAESSTADEKKWTTMRQYAIDASSFDGQGMCWVGIDDYPFADGTQFEDYNPRSQYFKWRVEFDEQKAMPIGILRNNPPPAK